MALVPLEVAGSREEPLSLDLAKKQLKVLHAREDDLIAANIIAARTHVEAVTWRTLVKQPYELTLDRFPCRPIRLPRPPLISVEEVSYLDTTGARVVMTAGTDYAVDLSSEPGRVAPAPDTIWPETQCGALAAVRVRFTAGYQAPRIIPAGMTLAMRLLVGHWYVNREAAVTGTISTEVQLGVMRLLRLLRFRAQVDL